MIIRFEFATSATVKPEGGSSRVREKPRIVILIQEFPHEGADLGVCLAHIPRRYNAADRVLCPDRPEWRADCGAGHGYGSGSGEQYEEVEKVIEESCKEEVEKTLHEPNEFGQATASFLNTSIHSRHSAS